MCFCSSCSRHVPPGSSKESFRRSLVPKEYGAFECIIKQKYTVCVRAAEKPSPIFFNGMVTAWPDEVICGGETLGESSCERSAWLRSFFSFFFFPQRGLNGKQRNVLSVTSGLFISH